MTGVKICGITRPRDAAAAVAAGANAVGVIFATSPRQVSVARAREIFDEVPAGTARAGVFVAPDPRVLCETVAACGLDWVQLSGGESAEFVNALRERVRRAVPDREVHVVKVIHMKCREPLSRYAGYLADLFLLDSAAEGRLGGTGQPFEWTHVTAVPWTRARLGLAGGLSTENVERAIAVVQPGFVDVASGVESSPGIKDATLITRFVAAVRRADRVSASSRPRAQAEARR